MTLELLLPSVVSLAGIAAVFVASRRATRNDEQARKDGNEDRDRANNRADFDSVEKARVDELERMEARLTRVEQRLGIAIGVIRSDRAVMMAAGLNPEPLPVELLGADI